MYDLTLSKRIIYSRLLLFPVAMVVLLLIPAGSFLYWQAWIYFSVIFFPMLFVLRYLIKRDPELLERRLRSKEKVKEQKIILNLFSLLFLIGFLIPGLDYRFGWSHVSVPVVIIANGLVFTGYMIFFSTMKANSYASRIIEVEEVQTVISSGPYAVIRHPMYAGWLLMIIATPVALGSYWALTVFIIITIPLLGRIVNEEKILLKELPGYDGYCRKIKYRLIPYVW
jgi:protein-S-isoprenylcysteine O-methyltransferase Ste14